MRFHDLLANKKSVDTALDILEISKSFPIEERSSLTDQIRRSSRIVSINNSESYRKRSYPRHYSSKLTDSDSDTDASGPKHKYV